MQSTHYAYSIGFAIKSNDERRFKAAVQGYLADNTVHEELSIWQNQLWSNTASRALKGLTGVLEDSERILLELRIEGIAYRDHVLDAQYHTDGAHAQFALAMQRWLAGQLVPGPVAGRPHASASELLFEATARWLFWYHILGPQESRHRFATSAATSSASNSQHLAKRGLQRQLEHNEPRLRECLDALAIPSYESVLPTVLPTVIRDQALGDRGPTSQGLAEVVRSTAPSRDHNVTGVVRRCDVEVLISLSEYGKRDTVSLDTGCGISVIARDFLMQMNPNVRVVPLRYPWVSGSAVRGADDVDKFSAKLDIYLEAEVRGRKAVICINEEVVVSDQYGGDMLFGMDIIQHHGIVIDSVRKVMTVAHCQSAVVPLEYIHDEYSQVVEDPEEQARVARVEQQIALRVLGHSSSSLQALANSTGSSEEGQFPAHAHHRLQNNTGRGLIGGAMVDEQ